jgi:Ca-activated chloride channel family protein
VLITDGDDTTSRASIEQAIEMALKNNVIIYAIRVPGDGSLNVRSLKGKPVLDRLTEATGGRQFHSDGDENHLAGFFTKLQDELRSQYSIGYQFQAASSDRSFHKLTIKLKQANLKAFTRRGYYSGMQ